MREGRFERDGVALFASDSGAVANGEPALLLIHGWSCDHTHLAPQVEHFAASHRVVSVDLRGHGASDAPEQEYTLRGFADDLAWLCGQLEVPRVVAIGHSMGGGVALALAASYQHLVAGVVLLDSPLTLSDDDRQGVRSLSAGMAGEHGGAVRQAFLDAILASTADAALRATVTAGVLAAPGHVASSAIGATAEWPVAASVRAPVLAIVADGGSLTPSQVPRDAGPPLWIGQTVGSGHFVQLEVPEQVNPMIERFLSLQIPGMPA
jgi:pimeloyl-ACP methyl ester carboxylesterase